MPPNLGILGNRIALAMGAWVANSHRSGKLFVASYGDGSAAGGTRVNADKNIHVEVPKVNEPARGCANGVGDIPLSP